VQASEYEDPWLTLSGRFQDGSLFKLCATQSGKRKRKPKRKYTKIKDRVQEEVSLVLRVSPEVYPHLERLQASLLPERLRHSARLEINAVQVEGPVVRVRVETGPFGRMVGRSGESTFNNELKLNGEKVIGLFAFLFAGLSHCRVDAPAQSRQA